MTFTPEPIPEARERVLRRRVALGDREAFRELVEPVLPHLYTATLRITNDPPAASDLTQQTLERALSKLDLYDPSYPLRPWMMAIAVNLWRSELRSPWRRLVRGISTVVSSDRRSAEALAIASDRDVSVRRALSHLPLAYREAVALFHLEGMSYAEMSLVTGVGVSALKQRVRRGNAMLREQMEKLYPELIPRRNG